MPRPKSKIDLYGLYWDRFMTRASIEIYMIQRGGQWRGRSGELLGRGLAYHYQQLQMALWPEKQWHRWNEMIIRALVEQRMIGLLGAASTGKTHEAALFALTDYYCFPDQTTVLCSSTEREMLEMRVWGEIKRYHRLAKEKHPWLPGNLIESRLRIITDEREAQSEGRDFRNGLCGVPCKKSGSYVGLGSFVGIKNKRVRMIADELHLMHKVFIDAISNLNKNPDFKCIGIGNPKDTTDPLGVFCEPASELGGWDGGIDQSGKSKTWKTRFNEGICVQLVGSDSPNMDAPEGSPPPYPFLITRKAIESDISFYGRDSLQFSMMNEGRMPRGQALRRVLTRQMCLKFGAMEPPIWKDSKREKIGCLDASYGSIGGDRCVFAEMQFGQEPTGQTVLAIIDTMLVPVDASSADLPEDQIALFVKAACESRGIPPQNVFFDSTGRGSLMGAFARLWSNHVVPVEFGGRPTERHVSNDLKVSCRDYYSKFVSELWWSVRLVVESRQFRGMTEEVMQEFCMREWGIVSGNKTEVETKESMKLKSGRSPDLADAIACGVEGARSRGFVIQRMRSNSVPDLNDEWKDNLRDKARKLQGTFTLNHSV